MVISDLLIFATALLFIECPIIGIIHIQLSQTGSFHLQYEFKIHAYLLMALELICISCLMIFNCINNALACLSVHLFKDTLIASRVL